VVIGYGTQRKGDITSAVASVKAEDFSVGKIGDAAELVKGKICRPEHHQIFRRPQRHVKYYVTRYYYHYR